MLDPAIRKAAQIMRTVESCEEGDGVDGYDRAGYYWHIVLEADGRWYIRVRAPNGGLLYDGWWNEYGKSLAEAVQEAVRGAGIVKERAASQQQGEPKQ